MFFPAPCALCQQVLSQASRVPVCSTCLASVRPLTREARCEGCEREIYGQPGASGILLCRYCATGAYAFERLRSYGEYDGPLGELIRVFKYRGVLALKDFLATCMARTAREEFELGEIQAIVPVPLHRSRERERGFNQSAVLARVLGRQLGLPVREALLLRHRKTRPQTGLTFAQRRQNVRGAFSVRPGVAIDNLRILLVDDVYTTGATAHACAKALRRAGARSVVVLTIARAS